MLREIAVAKTRLFSRSLEDACRDLADLPRGFLGQQSLRLAVAAASFFCCGRG
jgi:hypothetical protein